MISDERGKIQSTYHFSQKPFEIIEAKEEARDHVRGEGSWERGTA